MADKINVGWALEGTITGAIHRARFAEKISKLRNYKKLLEYMQHLEDCCVNGSWGPRLCTCGLDEFLRESD